MNELDRVRAAYPPLTEAEAPAATIDRLQALYADAVSVAQRRAEGPRHRRRRWPSRRIGLLAVGGVIVSGTAVAATAGSWRPLLGSPDRPRPVAASGGVPADQLAVLAVLRRPQTDADRGPLVRAALSKLDRRMVDGIHTDAIRVIAHGRREVTVLIPVQRIGGRVEGVPPSRSMQRNVLYVMSASYQHARTRTITSGGKTKTIRFPAGYNWGGTYGTLETLRTTGIQTTTSPDGSGGLVLDGHPERITNRVVTLVPDGVARVTVRLRGGRSVSVPVHDNVYRYTIRGISASLGTVWFDAAGRRIDHGRHR